MVSGIDNERYFSRRRLLQGTLAAAAVAMVPMALTGCDSADYTKAIQYAQTASTAVATVLSLLSIATGSGYIAAGVYSTTKEVLEEATIGITTIVAAIKEYEASPSSTVQAKIAAAVTAVEASLTSALVAANITDPTTLDTYTQEVNLILQFVQLIASYFPSSAMTLSAPSIFGKSRGLFGTRDPRKQFVQQFNTVITHGGHPKLVIQ